MERSATSRNAAGETLLKGAPRLLGRKVRRAQFMIVFERAWRALLWPFLVTGAFVLLSLAEVWSLLPGLAHKAGLAVFGVALIASLVPLARVRWPDREQGLRRLERVSGVRHRPASSFEDELGEDETGEGAPAEQRALWDLHRQRLAAMLARLTAGWPHPRLARADPYALRAALLLLLVVGLVAAGDSTWQRLSAAFSVESQNAAARFGINAWVTPPLYTARAPIVLADGADNQNIRQVTVPEKSLLLIRINGRGGGGPGVRANAAGSSLSRSVDAAREEDGFTEYKLTINEPLSVVVGVTGLARATWHFSVIKDAPPVVELSEEPSRTPRGAMRFGFRAQDDYGVAGAQARFALPGNTAKPAPDAGKIAPRLQAEGLAALGAGKALELFEPPVIPLTLPRANAKTAESRVYKDLTSHPWAGLRVVMTLVARDQAGQEGRSAPFELVLPSRKFTKPLAKAIVEQRMNLVRRPEERKPVERALDALTFAPEYFLEDKVLYLGLRSARWRLRHDKTPKGLKSVVAQLWDLALRVEDGDLPRAEADLKTAQEDLRRALEDGASEAEIAKLVERLRAALGRFLQAMAEKARQNGGLAQMPEGLSAQQTLTPKDLEQMLRNIENLARTGSREMAQRLLEELGGMMQRLQMGQASPNSQSRRMMNALQGLGEVIQRQQKLLDETFKELRERETREEDAREGRRRAERNGGPAERNGRRSGREGRGEGPLGRGRDGEGRQGRGRDGEGQQGRGRDGEGRSGQQGRGGEQQRYGALSSRQSGIRKRLDGLLEQLRTLGTRPPDQLEGAGRAMGEAEKALGEENLGRASQQQTLALDRLRQGTQSVAEQVLQTLTSAMGQGRQGNKDPFGRPERTQGPDLGTSVKIPDQIDIQRAREILDELRKRLGEPSRPLLELDYLERLIQKF